MNTRQLLGLVGSIVLMAGTFAPIVTFPLMGSMTYFQNGRNEGLIMLVLAAASLALALAKYFKGLWLTGAGILGVLLFTFASLQSNIAKMRSDMGSPLAGTPFHGLVDVAMQSVQFQWGWAVLLVGAALVIAAAALKEEVK